MRALLHEWGQSNLVTIVQVLPQHLWRQTALGIQRMVRFTQQIRLLNNRNLATAFVRAFAQAERPQGLAIPVIACNKAALTAWCKLLVAPEQAELLGFWFDQPTAPHKQHAAGEPHKLLTPQERLDRFRALASPQARKLAEYLAMAPLSLPIMQLVRQTMMPKEADHEHLAEVILGGLMRSNGPAEQRPAYAALHYTFIDGVDELLRHALPLDAAVKVWNELSSFLQSHSGQPTSFTAFIADPEALNLEDSAVGAAFAGITTRFLAALGGRYAQVAKRGGGRSKGRSEQPTPPQDKLLYSIEINLSEKFKLPHLNLEETTTLIKKLIAQMFVDQTDIATIEVAPLPKSSAGISTIGLLLAFAYTYDGVYQNPITIRIGRTPAIRREQASFQRYVEPYLGFERVRLKFQAWDESYSALGYEYVQRSSEPMQTLRSVLGYEHEHQATIQALELLFTQTIADPTRPRNGWCGDIQRYTDQRPLWFYNLVLPPTLTLREVEPTADALPAEAVLAMLARADQVDSHTLHGTPLAFASSTAYRVSIAPEEPEEDATGLIKLRCLLRESQAPPQGIKRPFDPIIARIELRVTPANLAAVQTALQDGTALMGTIAETRYHFLHALVKRHGFGFPLPQSASIEGLPVVDPLASYAQYLQRPGDLHTCIIHGDLNLGNVLIRRQRSGTEQTQMHAWLIDFDRTMAGGHAVYDFVKLETEYKCHILPFKLQQPDDILRLEAALYRAIFNPKAVAEILGNDVELKLAYDFIAAIRRLALVNLPAPRPSLREYYLGLLLTSVATLKYRNLYGDRRERWLHPEAAIEPLARAAYLAASFAATVIERVATLHTTEESYPEHTKAEALAKSNLAGLRVLVVDNDPELRQQTVALLEKWGCQAFAPTDTSQALLAAAKSAVKAYCCQLAVVDMRLLDDTSTQDISGLELVPELRPAFTIVYSAFASVRQAADAFHKYGAADFVAQEDGPEVLERALKRVVATHAIARHTSDTRRIDIEWSDGGQSLASLRQSLMEDKSYVPEDEAHDLIGRLFVDAQRVVLVPIVDEQLPSDAPLASTTSPNLRRETRVFLAQVDNQHARLVIKLGKSTKIKREVENYRRYIEHGLGGLFRPEMPGHKQLWNMGALTYRLIGYGELGLHDDPRSFTQFYRTEHDPSIILQPLQHFFHRQHWGRWYQTGVQPLDDSIFQAYDAMLHGKLSLSMQKRHALDRDTYFPALRQVLPNPIRWLSEHYQTTSRVANPRKAITHGDLHGDNLFVTPTHAWPIDFERTGEGPILRDFVELIQDILTRIAQFEL
ncbi:hypothetical protein CJ255_15005, partial [Candidatus Viridilinea mediisalina]